MNAEGEYDPSSPTSENNDETPAKKVALAVEADPPEKPEARPASPKKTTLPELDKYWKAVQDDPSDFTGWTYLLQYVDQEVNKTIESVHYCGIKLIKTKICTERCGSCARGLHKIFGALPVLLWLLEEIRGLREEERQYGKRSNGKPDIR